MLVRELWQLLDGGEDDHRLTAPRAHPLDPMDRASHKVIVVELYVHLTFKPLS